VLDSILKIGIFSLENALEATDSDPYVEFHLERYCSDYPLRVRKNSMRWDVVST